MVVTSTDTRRSPKPKRDEQRGPRPMFTLGHALDADKLTELLTAKAH